MRCPNKGREISNSEKLELVSSGKGFFVSSLEGLCQFDSYGNLLCKGEEVPCSNFKLFRDTFWEYVPTPLIERHKEDVVADYSMQWIYDKLIENMSEANVLNWLSTKAKKYGYELVKLEEEK